MSRKEVTVSEWECEACGKKHRGNDSTRTLPAGWTDGTTITLPGGMSTKGIDLCSECSKNPGQAAEHARAKWSG